MASMEYEHEQPINEATEQWDGSIDPANDPEEQRVVYAALDSFEYVFVCSSFRPCFSPFGN